MTLDDDAGRLLRRYGPRVVEVFGACTQCRSTIVLEVVEGKRGLRLLPTAQATQERRGGPVLHRCGGRLRLARR